MCTDHEEARDGQVDGPTQPRPARVGGLLLHELPPPRCGGEFPSPSPRPYPNPFHLCVAIDVIVPTPGRPDTVARAASPHGVVPRSQSSSARGGCHEARTTATFLSSGWVPPQTLLAPGTNAWAWPAAGTHRGTLEVPEDATMGKMDAGSVPGGRGSEIVLLDAKSSTGNRSLEHSTGVV